MSQESVSRRSLNLGLIISMAVAVLFVTYCASYLYLRLFKVGASGDGIVIINVDSDSDYPLELPSKTEVFAHEVFSPIVWLEQKISGRIIHIE
ncbi:hypothetical protein OAL00_03220 [Verrucomicrobiales bacterium]|nr:hypothetical protein [Verrucomicrobiales bacterium]